MVRLADPSGEGFAAATAPREAAGRDRGNVGVSRQRVGEVLGQCWNPPMAETGIEPEPEVEVDPAFTARIKADAATRWRQSIPRERDGLRAYSVCDRLNCAGRDRCSGSAEAESATACKDQDA